MIADYLIKKCKLKMEENYSLIKKSIANPIKFECTGALKEAAEGGLGGLAAFAEDYIEKNADTLLMSALKATGLEKTFMDAYNLAMNTLAMALMTKNNLVLRMLQECARTCMNELAEKDKILLDLAEKTKELYAILSSLVGTPARWDDYYGTLRQAMALISGAKSDLNLVANTFNKTDNWLDKRYERTITNLTSARDLISPKKNNPALSKINEGSVKVKRSIGVKSLGTYGSFSGEDKAKIAEDKEKRRKMHKDGEHDMKKGLSYFAEGLSNDFPFPTTEQQWKATLAIGKASKRVITAMKGYSEATLKCDALIVLFKAGLGALLTGMPKLFKDFILKLLEMNYSRMDVLARSMAMALNGSETNMSTSPPSAFRPNSLNITVKGFKWVMDINLILEGYKLIPATQLKNLNLASGPVNVYKSCVARLMQMNGQTSGIAKLSMVAGEETVSNLEAQMLAFVLEANNAVIGAQVRKEILAVGRSILGVLELSLKANSEIYDILGEFALMELPENDVLNQMFGGVMDMLHSAGLDRAAGLLMSGDYKKLFGSNAREASYVGAALAALAMLKNCFKTKAEKDKAQDIYADLKADADLLNISFSINFDLSIFKNLLDCINLNDLAKLFSIQELMCGLLQDALGDKKMESAQKMFDKVEDMFSF